MVYTDFKVVFNDNLIDLEEAMLKANATHFGVTEHSVSPTKRILLLKVQGDNIRDVIKYLAASVDTTSVGLIQEIINYEADHFQQLKLGV